MKKSVTKVILHEFLSQYENGLPISDICYALRQYDTTNALQILQNSRRYFTCLDNIHWKALMLTTQEESNNALKDKLNELLKSYPKGLCIKNLHKLLPEYGPTQIKRILKENNHIFTSCAGRWGVIGVFTYRDAVAQIEYQQRENERKSLRKATYKMPFPIEEELVFPRTAVSLVPSAKKNKTFHIKPQGCVGNCSTCTRDSCPLDDDY